MCVFYPDYSPRPLVSTLLVSWLRKSAHYCSVNMNPDQNVMLSQGEDLSDPVPIPVPEASLFETATMDAPSMDADTPIIDTRETGRFEGILTSHTGLGVLVGVLLVFVAIFLQRKLVPARFPPKTNRVPWEVRNPFIFGS